MSSHIWFAFLLAAWGREGALETALALTWTAEPDQELAWFGWSVSSAGDVNGDGYGDVVVGAPFHDNGETDEGRAFLYLGSSSGLATTAVWTAESDQDEAFFGVSVSTAGDVNGDGYGDVVVGASAYDNGETNEGRAYVYLGSPTGLAATAAWTAESDQAGGNGANFGGSVSSAGDVNGDGYGDVVVGAPFYNNGEAKEGRAYVYLGSATGLATTAAWTAEPDLKSALFGASVSSAGDVNGDGYADVVVGAPGEVRAYLYLGSPSGLGTSAAWTAASDDDSSEFGASVSSAGDVNGDGYGDVLVGAYNDNGGSLGEGKAYLYHGSVTGLATTEAWTVQSGVFAASYGSSVSSAGDVNGDGFGDVVVGADGEANGEFLEGRVYVYLGAASGLATTAAWTAEPDQADAHLGCAVSSAGDVNLDGYADVLVGAYGYDNGSADEGRVFVWLGSCVDDTLDSDADLIGDACDLCFGDDTSGDIDLDGVCAVSVDGSVGDCDDSNATVYPGATELCDGLDTACTGVVPAEELDLDVDGVVGCGGDCDDADASANPTRAEVCDDQIDNDCDGETDNGCPPLEEEEEPAGCSCASAGGVDAGGAAALALLLTMVARRRRNAPPTAAFHAAVSPKA